jgi:predicted dehydrogenase/threonine dehydrogenase-like Zn-dependent dehydrogenase
MEQILQTLRNGDIEIIDVPCPGVLRNQALVRSRVSLISSGTERMLLDFGRAGWIEKAQQQPDKVRKVLEKFRTDGLAATLDTVRTKLDEPISLGYSNAGVLLEAGAGVTEFKPGDRVVSNGPHAEVIAVPKNLCARIPDGVSDEAAAFTVVGAIALEGIRLAEPTLGETVVVTGLGLIGLITVQLLRAHGCRVLGIDLDPRKIALAQEFGAETVDLSKGQDPILVAEQFTRGKGVDGVILTLATKSQEPVHQAALMCRKRGRIVLVGVTGLELSRDDFYKKELSLQVSCSYGPGRHDTAYEQGGHDYPHSYVRWTAQRNFEAVLDIMADGRLNVERLVTHRFPFACALDAYKLLEGDEFYLGIVLEYPSEKSLETLLQKRVAVRSSFGPTPSAPSRKVSVGFIGAGGYASKILLPAFQKSGAGLVSVSSKGGLSAARAAHKFGFSEASTDTDAVFTDGRIDTVVVATRHDMHAALVCRGLKAGKHVFVEKPLALTSEQIDEIEQLYTSLDVQPLVLVGFNRRFAPHIVRAKKLLGEVKGSKSYIYTVNAGAIPGDHWTQDPEAGGGRIVGEACHFIDLLRYLTGCSIAAVETTRQSGDTVSIHLKFKDGSIGTIHYLSTGHNLFPKERLEIFCDGRILVIDNFRKMTGYGWPGFRRMNLWCQNKGAAEMVATYVKAIREGASSPIPFRELIEVARATFVAAN